LRRATIRPALEFVFDLPNGLRQLATNLKTKPTRIKPLVLQHVGNLKLMPIAPGSFFMGSTHEPGDESPITLVTLTKPYWLGATEVTQAQWDAVMGHNPSFFRGANLPVAQVNHSDALAFCSKVTERERAARRLPEGYSFTLPTEAQWEYACRAGTNSRYFTGDDPITLISHAKVFDLDTVKIWPQWQQYALDFHSHHEFASPVGSFLPNPFGLYDMIGNVWEWCSDWYAENYYQYSPTIDPQGPNEGEAKVRRGGSWHTWPLYCRSSFRNVNTPESRYILAGMRLVLED
jgi:formylglycine-generating enzyme required for sulfatase activity